VNCGDALPEPRHINPIDLDCTGAAIPHIYKGVTCTCGKLENRRNELFSVGFSAPLSKIAQN
jgi:hypothetical protein